MATSPNCSDQLEEIKTCIASIVKSNKLLAYSKLLHFQEQIRSNNSLIQSLAESSRLLLSSILVDINHSDEEIAAVALKSLGFMIFHPPILAGIPGDDANLILDSLVNLIKTTRIKSICNLGLWCISIQQFNTSFLASHLNSLLTAIVHALNNPIGSLSTTYEATQAIIRLTTQLNQTMSDASHIWAPPIYRRLVSNDKREIDMVEKCLLNIRSTLLPPPAFLSKVVALDMKEKLLKSMIELVNNGMKLRALQAWGFYIRMIGNYAVIKKNLVNEMLKIPQQTFSDSDSQVQIATLVAWEGLIDALIQPEKPSEANCSENSADKFSRRIKLIMTPLFGILSSNCYFTVHSQCLNTWSYLLQKVNISVYSSLVKNAICLPIFELVFKHEPNITSTPLWNFCLDILDDKNSTCGQWNSWDIGRLDFVLRMVGVTIGHTSVKNLESEMKNFACNASLRLFIFVLRGISNLFRKSSTSNTDLMSCLNATLTFVKKICEGTPQISLKFLESVTEELEYSILGSSQYKLPLSITNNDKFGSASEFSDAINMVLPIEYLTALYFDILDKLTTDSPETESINQGMFKMINSLFSSYDLTQILDVSSRLLSRNSVSDGLNTWVVIANCIKDYIEDDKNISRLKTVFHKNGYVLICRTLCYPFTVIQKQFKLEIELIGQVWKSLYDSVLRASRFEYSSTSFSEDLYRTLIEILDEFASNSSSGTEFDAGKSRFISLCGDMVIHVLEENSTPDMNIRGSEIDNRLRLAARFMTLIQANPSTISRFISSLIRVARSLHREEFIISFIKIFSSPLLHWLSCEGKIDEHHTQFQILWNEILDSIRTNMPLSNFNSSFLDLQSTLLTKTLNHESLAISEPTITFWNTTYGEQINLDYPQILLPVLENLSRTETIKLRKKITVVPPVSVNTGNSKRVRLVEDNVIFSKRKKYENLTERQKEVRRAQQGKTRDCEGRGPGVCTYTSVDFSQANDYEDDFSQENQDFYCGY